MKLIFHAFMSEDGQFVLDFGSEHLLQGMIASYNLANSCECFSEPFSELYKIVEKIKSPTGLLPQPHRIAHRPGQLVFSTCSTAEQNMIALNCLTLQIQECLMELLTIGTPSKQDDQFSYYDLSQITFAQTHRRKQIPTIHFSTNHPVINESGILQIVFDAETEKFSPSIIYATDLKPAQVPKGFDPPRSNETIADRLQRRRQAAVDRQIIFIEQQRRRIPDNAPSASACTLEKSTPVDNTQIMTTALTADEHSALLQRQREKKPELQRLPPMPAASSSRQYQPVAEARQPQQMPSASLAASPLKQSGQAHDQRPSERPFLPYLYFLPSNPDVLLRDQGSQTSSASAPAASALGQRNRPKTQGQDQYPSHSPLSFPPSSWALLQDQAQQPSSSPVASSSSGHDNAAQAQASPLPTNILPSKPQKSLRDQAQQTSSAPASPSSSGQDSVAEFSQQQPGRYQSFSSLFAEAEQREEESQQASPSAPPAVQASSKQGGYQSFPPAAHEPQNNSVSAPSSTPAGDRAQKASTPLQRANDRMQELLRQYETAKKNPSVNLEVLMILQQDFFNLVILQQRTLQIWEPSRDRKYSRSLDLPSGWQTTRLPKTAPQLLTPAGQKPEWNQRQLKLSQAIQDLRQKYTETIQKYPSHLHTLEGYLNSLHLLSDEQKQQLQQYSWLPQDSDQRQQTGIYYFSTTQR